MTKKTTKKKTAHMGFVRLPLSLWARLESAAVVEERDRSTVLRRALVEYLDKHYPLDSIASTSAPQHDTTSESESEVTT